MDKPTREEQEKEMRELSDLIWFRAFDSYGELDETIDQVLADYKITLEEWSEFQRRRHVERSLEQVGAAGIFLTDLAEYHGITHPDLLERLRVIGAVKGEDGRIRLAGELAGSAARPFAGITGHSPVRRPLLQTEIAGHRRAWLVDEDVQVQRLFQEAGAAGLLLDDLAQYLGRPPQEVLERLKVEGAVKGEDGRFRLPCRTFTVATYNVLATAYISPEWYPFTPKEFLDPQRRIPALAEHLAALNADIYCLQEVEAETFAAIDRHLSVLGYHGELAKKGGGKPDGCAIFFRKSLFELVRVSRLEYLDGAAGGEHSGHVAQMVLLKDDGRLLGIANTHLKWDPPETPRKEQVGYRQIVQLLNARDRHAPQGTAWIVCGDLNAEPSSDVVAALRAADLEFTHAACQGTVTSNANGRAKMIDFIFYNAMLQSRPEPLPTIEDHTPLPGPGQPSDHVAVAARFEWGS